MTNIKAFEYQKQAISNSMSLIESWEVSWLLEMATWTWKTITSALIIKEYEARFWYKKHIFIVPKNTILTNIIRDYEKVFPEKKIWIWNTANKDEDWDILLTTFHSLSTQRVFDKFWYEHYWIIVFDEAHLSDNNSCEIIKDMYSYSFILNQTATPFIQSKTETFLQKMAWWNLIYKLWIFEAIWKWYLAKPNYKVLYDSQNWEAIEEILRNSWSAEYSKKLTQDYVSSLARNKFVLKRLQNDWVIDKHKNFLVYCITLKHLSAVVKYWKSVWVINDWNYAVITWSTSQERREQYFKEFETWKIKFIFSIRTLTEWVDIKWAEAIINLAPTKSKVLFFQKLWRVIRKEEWKEFWYVYDFVFDILQKKRIWDWLKEKLILEKLKDKSTSVSEKDRDTKNDKNEFDKVMEEVKDTWFEIEFDEEIFIIEDQMNKKLTPDEMKDSYLKRVWNVPVVKAYYDKIAIVDFTSSEALAVFWNWNNFLDFVWVAWVTDEETNSMFDELTEEEVLKIMKDLAKDKFWNLRFWILDYNRLSNKPFDTSNLIRMFKSWNILMQKLWLEKIIWKQLISRERVLNLYKDKLWNKILSIQQYSKLDSKPLTLKAIQNIFWTWKEFNDFLTNNLK